MELKDNKHYPSLIGRSIEELEIISTSIGEPPYRGRQLFDWIYRKKVDDVTKMTDLSKLSQDKLKVYPMHPLKILKTNNSLSKKTQKYLFITKNGNKIESVLMKKGNYTTLCLSTQVGCAVDCAFCATAKMGFIQNLSTGEIIDQYLQLAKISVTKITNVVFMGMGEPFLNYENSIAAARLLNHVKGINLGARRITISTAGIIGKIKKYTSEKHPYRLAVSLNSTNQNQRLKIMPITKNHTFINLLSAIKDYTIKTRRRITIEYVLISGINDCQKDSIKLREILSSIKCNLNIIPYNEINSTHKRPEKNLIKDFLNPLLNAPFPVTVRWSKGQDIDAGCGQLATNVK
ncbi:MAG: 23S rRNA (adenine(2503)-C(2))-methyltransferase RlmN [Candidatus Marinimicrobia bacterium]|nr:23S rRNA (adenine(2503)-C(2))-methyltransferase RlmN [Candidatus Neomarinimicrobiota bacterium]